jgi:phosphohistidine phosphatase
MQHKRKKTLIILRHGKAASGSADGDDAARPLTSIGQNEAANVAHYLLNHGFSIDMALCSSAVRTRQTLACLVELGVSPADTQFVDSLYLASPGDVLHSIEALPQSCHTLLVVGHNPGLHELATQLASSGQDALLQDIALHFPTCALAVITFEMQDWADTGDARGTLDAFVTP